MRLIDANALIANLEKIAKDDKTNYFHLDEITQEIFDAPTVDAVEVVPGRWIPLEYDGYADGSPVWDLWECSECQDEHSGDEDTLTPYCPNCGAKMDGGDEDGVDD